MKKDIEWFMEQMKSMTKMRDPDREPESWYISEGALLEALDQLDEPEVLSQEWISEHKHYYPVTAFNNSAKEIVDVEDLQNLLVPKQEKVIIEGVWAEDIEEAKENGMTLFKTMDWMGIDSDDKEKQNLFARAWLDGFTVEERELTVKGVIEEHIELLKKQAETVDLKPYYDLLEELKNG